MALTEANGRPAVWVVDPATQTVSLRNIDVVRYDPATVIVSPRALKRVTWSSPPGCRRCGRDRRCACSERHRDEGPNLSDWAIRHRSFVIFLMIMVSAAGLGSYRRLGRSEDPAFTIKTMIVQATWPGATLNDTLLQVTERLERKLQETPNLDYLRSYTTPARRPSSST